jgi:redox-sensitive bicupin YhaK (pirin superfamily)
MITIRKSGERGFFDHGWLKTHHTFAFDRYYDPDHIQFRDLRVINEDFIAPGTEFPTHPHRDMEIITYVLEGELTHRDSMGHEAVLRRDEVQAMTAGSGITHSESNRSGSEVAHILQIWILPGSRGLTPTYRDKEFAASEKQGQWRLIASPDGRDDSLTIHQDVSLYASILAAGNSLEKSLAAGRYGWLQVARGAVDLNGLRLNQGDGAAIVEETALTAKAIDAAEVLLFDLK